MHREDHRGLSPPPAEGWNVPGPEKGIPVPRESGVSIFVIGWHGHRKHGVCRLLLGEDALAMLCVIPDLTIKPVRLGSHASRSLLACRLWVTAET